MTPRDVDELTLTEFDICTQSIDDYISEQKKARSQRGN